MNIRVLFAPSFGVHFLLSIAIVSAAQCVLLGQTTPTDRPNIVMILADDMGNNDLQNMPRTLATFASRGTTLNLYSHQNCAPSRTALMTGMNPMLFGQHNVFPPPLNDGLPAETVLLPEHLQAAGYRTGGFGKWHLGWREQQIPINNGFDKFTGCVGGFISHYGAWSANHVYSDGSTGHSHHGAHDMTKDGVPYYNRKYSTRLFRDEAVAFLRDQDDSDPFFLYVPFTAPHAPYQAPRISFDAVKAQYGIEPGDEEYLSTYAADVIGISTATRVPADVRLRLHRAIYGAMLRELDIAVNLIWLELVEKGFDENTVFLFASDNGGIPSVTDNGPLRGGKGTPFEGGHRVANAIIAPGIEPRQIVDANIWFGDLMPTFLEYAGATIPQQLDGVSAVPALTDNKEIFRGNISSFFRGTLNSVPAHIDKRYRPRTDQVLGSCAINLENLKYIRFFEFDLSGTEILSFNEALYDLQQDPLELSSRHRDSNYSMQLVLMRFHYDLWVSDETMEALRTANVLEGIWADFDLPAEWGAYPDP